MAIICNNLVLGYKIPLTNPFDLNLCDHSFFGIIGSNGSGKSTFLKTLLGLVKPLDGAVAICEYKPKQYNRYISYIPQQRDINLSDSMSGYTLVSMSFDGYAFGVSLKDNTKHINHVCNLVGASSFIHQKWHTLSGGQKKRIYLAQALVNNPKLLFLDEPLADLDPVAREHFIKVLVQIKSKLNLGVLIISHDMHEISEHLDGFIHFKNHAVHYCCTLPCLQEDVYVG